MTSLRFMVVTALGVLPSACAHAAPSVSATSALAKAEALIDAFYSFDPQPLRTAMATAPDSQPIILYYQGWAEGGNYHVLDRKPCAFAKPDEIACSITVKDDLIGALGTGYDVTDTFHLTVEKGQIVKVRTSSNDPPEFEQALTWVRARQPDLVTTGPCRGFFAGGPTPGDCVRAIVKGFGEFAKRPRP